MQIGVRDLLCPTCRGYVHPFLERCPGCGAARQSRLGDVGSGMPLGLAALVDDEATQSHVRSVTMRYATSVASGPAGNLAEGLGVVAGSLRYRAWIAGARPGGDAVPGRGDAGQVGGSGDAPMAVPAVAIVIDRGTLLVRARPGGTTLAAVPLSAVVAVTPVTRGRPDRAAWAGIVLGSRQLLAERPVADANLLVTFSTADGAGMVALANPAGLLAPRAGPDHYEVMARWIGLLAAAEAEARWTSIGAEAYGVELGLVDAPATAPGMGTGAAWPSAGTGAASGAWVAPAGVPAGGIGAAGAIGAAGGTGFPGAAGSAGEVSTDAAVLGVRASLEELNGLRSAGLVTDEEYAAKRREILARL